MFVRRGLVAFKSQVRNLCYTAKENAGNLITLGMIKTLEEHGIAPDTAKPIAKVLNAAYEKLSQSFVSKEKLRTHEITMENILKLHMSEVESSQYHHFVLMQTEMEKLKFDMEKNLGDIIVKIDKLSDEMDARADKLIAAMDARVDKLTAAMDARGAAMDARVDKFSEVMDARSKEVLARIDAGKFDALKIYLGLSGCLMGVFAAAKYFNP